MKRVGELDIPDRFAPRVPVVVTQILVAVAATAMAFAVRESSDLVMPTAGPFALIFPSVLFAALFARWLSGLLALIMCVVFVWYFVLPVQGSFTLEDPWNPLRVAVNVVSGGLILILAEVFRRAVRRAVQERTDALEKRDLYLREFDHRVKNSFSMIVSLLELQRRELDDDDPAADALGKAAMRVGSFARAHQSLYRGDGLPDRVDMKSYMEELCASLEASLTLPEGIVFQCSAEQIWLPRDRAIAVGLILNELATNAAKYAFVGRETGRIEIVFRENEDREICLVMTDDGVGIQDEESGGGGLGQRLIDAFAREAQATLFQESSARGTRFVLTLAPEREE